MPADQQNKLFCFGYGYSCDYLGYALQEQEEPWILAGTTRDLEKQRSMRAQKIKSFVFDYHKPLEDPQLFLDGVTHLLISTPPDDHGDPAFNMHADDILSLNLAPDIKYNRPITKGCSHH